MKTIYYTQNFNKLLYEGNSITPLDIGQHIVLWGKDYKIVEKSYNITGNVMVYQCNPL